MQDSRTAFFFPGQGSQSVGMLSDLIEKFPAIKNTFSEASDVLGFDAWLLAQEGPEEKLNRTDYTQPVLLAADIAMWRIWQTQSEAPAYLAGHSLGEYAALVCAGVIRFSDALKLVQVRGQAMQSASPEGVGAMAAILGLQDAEVAEICVAASIQTEASVTPANYNAIGQVVVAGDKAAVLAAIALGQSAGAKLAKLIPVSVPSHCALMRSAVPALKTALDAVVVNVPRIPVIHNVDLKTHDAPEAIRTALLEQLTQPVRWVETVQWILSEGVTQFVECGPGRVLTSLIKRIDKSMTPLHLEIE